MLSILKNDFANFIHKAYGLILCQISIIVSIVVYLAGQSLSTFFVLLLITQVISLICTYNYRVREAAAESERLKKL